MIVVGPQCRANHGKVGAQDAVLVEARHFVEGTQDALPNALGGALAPLAGQRKLRFEQPHQLSRDRRLRHGDAFHVGLAERNPGLQQVAAVGAQHDDLACAQAGAQQQAIEAIVLHLAAPGGQEGFLEQRLERDEVGALDIAGFEYEILDHRATRIVSHRIVVLLEHAQSEVLEHRQDVGNRNQAAGPQDAQVHVVGGAPGMRAQIELRNGGVRRQGFEVGDVLEGLRGLDVHTIRRRKQPGVSTGQFHRIAGRAARDQFMQQPVLPGLRGGRDLGFDACDVVHRRRTGLCVHQQMKSRQRGIGDLHLGLDVSRAESRANDAFDALAHFGVVAVARHVHQAGIETFVAVAAHEQPDAAAFVQIDDATHDGDELGSRSLEQLVAREGFDDIDHRLGVMALRWQPEMFDHRIELAPQERNVRRRRVVGARRPQAEEAMFTGDIAGGIEGLDADVIDVTGTMNGRGGVRLGEHQQVGCTRLAPQVSGQHDGRRGFAPAAGAQDAEAAVDVAHQCVARAAAFQTVVAIAQENEMPVMHPGEQRPRLRHV